MQARWDAPDVLDYLIYAFWLALAAAIPEESQVVPSTSVNSRSLQTRHFPILHPRVWRTLWHLGKLHRPGAVKLSTENGAVERVVPTPLNCTVRSTTFHATYHLIEFRMKATSSPSPTYIAHTNSPLLSMSGSTSASFSKSMSSTGSPK